MGFLDVSNCLHVNSLISDVVEGSLELARAKLISLLALHILFSSAAQRSV